MAAEKTIDLLLWGLGGCVTGFLFLLGYVITLSIRIEKCVSYDWLEKTFEPRIMARFDCIEASVKEMHDYIIGNFEKKGLVSRLDDIEDRVQKLEGK